jgi:hypothetical protein
MSEKKEVKRVQFYLTRPNASYGAGAYTHPDTGDYMFVTMSKDKEGNPIPYRFVFRRGPGRILTMPEGWKDVTGKSMAEFLRNHPECEGSPNNRGQICYFKEIDVEKDAEVMLEIEQLVLQAKNAAAKLTGDKLKYVAILIGEPSDNTNKQLVSILKYAEANPKDLLKLIDGPDVEVRALIREGVAKQAIELKGTIHIWERVHLGGDENEAVAKVLADKDLLTALKRTISLKKSK